jgi:hypothetical protein
MIPLILLMTATMIPADSARRSGMQELVPAAIREWSPSEPLRGYAGREIFDYMDGAGEVYLAYGFREIAVQRYARANHEEILLEVFDMGTPAMAFGTFTYMKGRGPAVLIGQDGEFKSGLLTFWKDRYFVCVKTDHETEASAGAVLDLGTAVAGAIPHEGERPALVGMIPPAEYMPASLRYFSRHEILNNHFYVADANLLRLSERTECLLVRLNRDRSYLLLVRYPDAALADSARASFLAGYLPEAGQKGILKTENQKWTACDARGRHVIVVFDAPTERQAGATLDWMRRRLP